MKLARLLELHDTHTHELGLKDNLGDGYLCRHNSVYRAIRAAAGEAGFAFAADPDAAYAALPLSQLDAVLTSKKIPYYNNVDVLRSVEAAMPGTTDWGEVRENLRRNFLFHESCHAVARARAGNIGAEQPRLLFLLEESFANTCELLGIIEASETAHKVFYEWNSYTALHEYRRHLEAAIRDLGRDIVVRWLLLGYLHSNFLFDQLTDSHFKRLLALAAGDRAGQLAPPQLKTLRALVRICFALDEKFRRVTTGFYLRLRGVPAGTPGNFEYGDTLERNSAYREYIGRLAAVLS